MTNPFGRQPDAGHWKITGIIMNLQELQERIARWDDLHTEFKEWPVRSDDLAASLVAFANTDGGQLILGVDKHRSVTGIEEPDRISCAVDRIATNSCEPPIAVTQEVLRTEDCLTQKSEDSKDLQKKHVVVITRVV